jgi:ATP-dependent DNA ligase
MVSKRSGSIYRGGESHDWVKVKVYETGRFVITGVRELGEGRLEAVYVAEVRDGTLIPAGQVQFGLAGKGLWHRLDRMRAGLPSRKGFVPVRPELQVTMKYISGATALAGSGMACC